MGGAESKWSPLRWPHSTFGEDLKHSSIDLIILAVHRQPRLRRQTGGGGCRRVARLAVEVGGAESKMVAAAGVGVVLDEGRLIGQAELVIILHIVHLVLVREQDARLGRPARENNNR